MFPAVATVMFAVAAVAFALIAVVAVANGDLLRFVLGSGGMVFGAAGALALSHRLRLRKPLTAGAVTLERANPGTSVAISMDRSVTVSLAAAFLGGAVFLVALALMRMTGDQVQPLQVMSGVFFIIVAIACVALAPLMIATTRVPRRLVLSEHGIHQNNGALDQYLPWQSIAAVDAVEADPTEGRSRRRIPMILLRPTSPSDIAILWRFRWFSQRTFLTAISVQPTAYPIDAGLLYYTIRFYWQHPELRTELSSDTAVLRIRRGDVLG